MKALMMRIRIDRTQAQIMVALSVFVLTSCVLTERNTNKATNSPTLEEIAHRVFIDGKVLSFGELPSGQQTAAVNDKRGCVVFAPRGSALRGEQVIKDVKSCYFVQTTIDADALAYLTFLYSCGSAISVRRCSDQELQKQSQDALSNPVGRFYTYGKAGRWKFFDGDSEILARGRSEYCIQTCEEVGHNPLRHKILIGPIPGKPSRVVAEIQYNLSESGQRLPDPQFVLR